jgi:hypothetical protein
MLTEEQRQTILTTICVAVLIAVAFFFANAGQGYSLGNYIVDSLAIFAYGFAIERGEENEQVDDFHLPAFRNVPGSRDGACSS